ncbi:MAG: hypothetical protein AAGJ91_13225 [Pseudomonadota bacterium]
MGVGNRFEWHLENPEVGAVTQEIIVSDASNVARSALDFGEMGPAEAVFDISDCGAGSSVTRGLETDMGPGPVGRWMGRMMDRWFGADYEAGQANLKALIEDS